MGPRSCQERALRGVARGVQRGCDHRPPVAHARARGGPGHGPDGPADALDASGDEARGDLARPCSIGEQASDSPEHLGRLGLGSRRRTVAICSAPMCARRKDVDAFGAGQSASRDAKGLHVLPGLAGGLACPPPGGVARVARLLEAEVTAENFPSWQPAHDARDQVHGLVDGALATWLRSAR